MSYQVQGTEFFGVYFYKLTRYQGKLIFISKKQKERVKYLTTFEYLGYIYFRKWCLTARGMKLLNVKPRVIRFSISIMGEILLNADLKSTAIAF